MDTPETDKTKETEESQKETVKQESMQQVDTYAVKYIRHSEKLHSISL